MRQIRRARRPSHATVVAYLALFVALGGTGAWASHEVINSSDVVDESLRGEDVMGKHGTSTVAGVNGRLTGADISGQPAIPSVGQPFVEGSLTSFDIKNSTVATDDLANGAVTPSKLGTIPAARAQNSSDQSIPDTVFTALAFDSEAPVGFDTAGLHSNSVNNSRLTAPISGIYQVNAGVEWASNPTGRRSLGIWVNGVNSGFGLQVASESTEASNFQTVSTLVKLGTNDFVEAGVAQTSGDNLNARFHRVTFLAMHWVGPG